MKRTLLGALGAAAFMTAALATGASAAQDEPLKIGFVYVGPADDHGWTFRHDVGRQAVEKAFGDKVETTFVELVSEGPDSERVIRQLAESGNKLIFATSFGFGNSVIRVAREFPDVRFEHATGFRRADNVATYSGRFYEGRPIQGQIAARMTKSNIVGYVASLPIPEVIRGINAFTLQARRVNPDIEVRVVWINSFFDPPAESAAARTLLDQGADVIAKHTDSPAPDQEAEARGAIAFGNDADQSQFAPDADATATINIWGPYYVARTQAVLDGTWTSGDTWEGLAGGMVAIAPFASWLPDDVKAEAQALVDETKTGEFFAFTGPIRNQAGELVAAEGERLTDEQLLTMDFFVEGVVGSIPQ